MNINVKPRFSTGEEVWGAFRPTDVNFDDRLPVVKLKIEDIKFRGTLYSSGELNVDIHYRVEEINGWSSHTLKETELFMNKKDAEIEARKLTESEVERFEKKLLQASNMLISSNS